MTKTQKALFKQLNKRKHQEVFLETLIVQQERLGTSKSWQEQYKKRCDKKKITMPEHLLSQMR